MFFFLLFFFSLCLNPAPSIPVLLEKTRLFTSLHVWTIKLFFSLSLVSTYRRLKRAGWMPKKDGPSKRLSEQSSCQYLLTVAWQYLPTTVWGKSLLPMLTKQWGNLVVIQLLCFAEGAHSAVHLMPLTNYTRSLTICLMKYVKCGPQHRECAWRWWNIKID